MEILKLGKNQLKIDDAPWINQLILFSSVKSTLHNKVDGKNSLERSGEDGPSKGMVLRQLVYILI